MQSGALEHSTSSLYSLNESNPEAFAQNFRDVAAHEFFHILTPLSVHSEEIQYFDFTDPKMSEHLWLYEGSTEYHAHKAQLQAKLISVDRFLTVMGTKITSSRMSFNDTLPFTFMSKNVLDTAYEKQYGNVYQKGALINLCLDVKLRQLSGGKYGIMNLIQDLSAKYGKGKPFKDAELFAVIGKLTYPQIQQFLETYVSGNTPLPLDEVFNATGIRWTKDTSVQVFSFGGFRARAAGNSIYLALVNLDEFGKKMDYHVGDTVVSVNGTAVNPKNFGAISARIAATAKPGDQLSMEVIRNVNGTMQHITLQQPVQFVPQKRYNILKLDPDATPAQLALRNAWFQVTP
jgi:predicted metalloprotease with PDZ domain